MDPPVALQTVKFTKFDFLNRGVLTGPIDFMRPCDQWFLEFVEKDIAGFALKLACYLPKLLAMKDELPFGILEAAQFAKHAMIEADRLGSAPELFPTAESKINFMQMLKYYSKGFQFLAFTMGKLKTIDTNTMGFIPGMLTALRAKKIGEVWYQMPDTNMVVVPFNHLRSKAPEKPWNKFMNNNATIDGNGSMNKILQVIPFSGWMLLRRENYMYRVVEDSFSAANRIMQQSKDRKALLEATGEDHGDVLTPAVTNWDVGFPQGISNPCDSDGVITVESLAAGLAGFQGREVYFPSASHVVLEMVRP